MVAASLRPPELLDGLRERWEAVAGVQLAQGHEEIRSQERRSASLISLVDPPGLGSCEDGPRCGCVQGASASLHRLVEASVERRTSARQVVHPSWQRFDSQLAAELACEMATVPMQQVVVATEPFSGQLFDETVKILFGDFGRPESNILPVAMQFVAPGRTAEHSTALVAVPEAPLLPVDLHGGMERTGPYGTHAQHVRLLHDSMARHIIDM